MKKVKHYDWEEEKNKKLNTERGISFVEILLAIKNNRILDIQNHPNNKRYPNQKIYIVEINEYAYLVPFMEDDEKFFLKTIIPSRKATKRYIVERKMK